MSVPIDARERLAAVTRTALLDTPPEEAFDRLTRMAARLLGAPVSLITLVTDDRQFFKSATGLPEPWASRRSSPLSHSFCRHVAVSGEPLVVEDTRRHPLLRSNPAVRELGWTAYAGVPLVTRQGYVVGAFSVVDGMPRLWSDRDVALLRDLAACAASEIELRAQDAGEPAKSALGNGGPRPPDVFEDTGIPMGVASSEGRWTRVNRALCELLGYREDELLGGLAEGIIHPDDRPVQREAVRLLLAGECPSYTSEYQCQRRNGEPTWGLVTVTLVADEERRPRHFVFAIQDISDRKRAESELRESEERYRLVVQATRTAAWDWDLITNRVVWGDGLETLLGHSPSGLTTSASWWYERIHAEDRERVVSGIQGALGRGERSWEQEYRFRRGDGSYARVVVRSYVVTDRSGEPVRVVGALADVTGAREVEAELRADIADRKRAESLAAGQSRLLQRIAGGEDLGEVLEGIVRFAEQQGGGFVASLMTLEKGGDQLRLASAPSLPAEYRDSSAAGAGRPQPRELRHRGVPPRAGHRARHRDRSAVGVPRARGRPRGGVPCLLVGPDRSRPPVPCSGPSPTTTASAGSLLRTRSVSWRSPASSRESPSSGHATWRRWRSPPGCSSRCWRRSPSGSGWWDPADGSCTATPRDSRSGVAGASSGSMGSISSRAGGWRAGARSRRTNGRPLARCSAARSRSTS